MAWKKGESGNPKGPQIGTRKRLTEAFLRDLEEHWRKNGPRALDLAMENNPAQFVAIVAKLLPQDVQLTAADSFLDALKQINDLRQLAPALGEERERPAPVRH